MDDPKAKNKWRARQDGEANWKYFENKDKAEAYAEGESESVGEKVKATGAAIIAKAKSMVAEQKEFFREEGHQPGSKERRKLKEAMQSKAKGVLKALKQEGQKYQEAASSLKSLAKGEKITKEQKSALASVATTIAIAGATTAFTGGAGAPMGRLMGMVAKGVARSVLNSSAMKGLIFGTRVAQEEVEDEVALTLFINEVAEKMASVAISPEQWVELIEESNEGV